MTDIDDFRAAWEQQLDQRPLGRKQCCSNCAYWEPNCIDPDDIDEEGDCHRHAPGVMHFGVTQIGNTIGAIAWAVEETAGIEHDKKETDYRFESTHDLWPCWARTTAGDWCGDFIARKQPLQRPKDKAKVEPGT